MQQIVCQVAAVPTVACLVQQILCNAGYALALTLVSFPFAAAAALLLSGVVRQRREVLFGCCAVAFAVAAAGVFWHWIPWNTCILWLLSIFVCVEILAADRWIKARSGRGS